MILFLNVFVTDKRLSPHFKWERGLLPPDNRLDILKYSLASFRCINNWSKVILYIALDKNYANREEELVKFIYDEYKGIPILYFPYRLTKQSEWQQALQDHVFGQPDELVWYFCNDDHVFLDSNLETIYRIANFLEQSAYEFKTCYLSHWPELSNKAIKEHWIKQEEGWYGLTTINDSVQLVNQSWLYYTWFANDYNEAFMPRPDFTTQAVAPESFCCVPSRELCRHYDGYSHVGISINEWPPLRIPPGFFEKNIKLRYGFEDNLDDCVNINCNKQNFTTVDKQGADYKWPTSQYPLFWQNRISQVTIKQ